MPTNNRIFTLALRALAVPGFLLICNFAVSATMLAHWLLGNG